MSIRPVGLVELNERGALCPQSRMIRGPDPGLTTMLNLICV